MKTILKDALMQDYIQCDHVIVHAKMNYDLSAQLYGNEIDLNLA